MCQHNERLNANGGIPPRALFIVVYYETIKRELYKRLIYECRCDARLKAQVEGSTCLSYTGLREGLEQVKIETKLTNERFASAMGECVILKTQTLHRYSK